MVLNLGDSRRVIRDATFGIPLDGVVCPRTVPEPVNHVHVFVGDLIALIVRHEILSESLRSGLGPAGHHVPGDAPFGEMIERAESTGEGKGRNVACASCHAERD